MRHRRAAAGLHRQRRLRAIEGLALGLLIEAEHHRAFGRVHVEPDDIDELRLEVRVGRDLERVDLPRLELMIPPDPRHRVLADLVPGRHQPRRPVRRPIVGLGVQRVMHHRRHRPIGKPRTATPTRRDDPDTLNTGLRETGPPPAHRVRCRGAPPGDLLVRNPIGCQQQTPGLDHLAVRQRRRPRHLLQRHPIPSLEPQRSSDNDRHPLTLTHVAISATDH